MFAPTHVGIEGYHRANALHVIPYKRRSRREHSTCHPELAEVCAVEACRAARTDERSLRSEEGIYERLLIAFCNECYFPLVRYINLVTRSLRRFAPWFWIGSRTRCVFAPSPKLRQAQDDMGNAERCSYMSCGRDIFRQGRNVICRYATLYAPTARELLSLARAGRGNAERCSYMSCGRDIFRQGRNVICRYATLYAPTARELLSSARFGWWQAGQRGSLQLYVLRTCYISPRAKCNMSLRDVICAYGARTLVEQTGSRWSLAARESY